MQSKQTVTIVLILCFSCFSGGINLLLRDLTSLIVRHKNKFFCTWVPKASPMPLSCFLSYDWRFPFSFSLKSSREEESREYQVTLGHDCEIRFPGWPRLASSLLRTPHHILHLNKSQIMLQTSYNPACFSPESLWRSNHPQQPKTWSRNHEFILVHSCWGFFFVCFK